MPNARGWRRFHVVCVNFIPLVTQCEPSFQCNMGFRPITISITIRPARSIPMLWKGMANAQPKRGVALYNIFLRLQYQVFMS